MTKLRSRLMKNVKDHPFEVSVAKCNVSPSGTKAKVLFSTNKRGEKETAFLKDRHSVETAFSELLGEDARIVSKSICPADRGMYFGMVVANVQTVALEDAAKKGSGFDLVQANMFADADDNIWTLQEESDGGEKILIRTQNDDLKSILDTRMSSVSMTTAANQSIDDSFTPGCFVRTIDNKERVHHGFAVDTSTIYSSEAKVFLPSDSISCVSFVEANQEVVNGIAGAIGDSVSTFQELSRTQVKTLREYLSTLYAHAPDFLQNYLNVIERHVDM